MTRHLQWGLELVWTLTARLKSLKLAASDRVGRGVHDAVRRCKGLVTNDGERGGGYKTGGGGHVKFDPYEKGVGVGKVLAMLKGGGGALTVLG